MRSSLTYMLSWTAGLFLFVSGAFLLRYRLFRRPATGALGLLLVPCFACEYLLIAIISSYTNPFTDIACAWIGYVVPIFSTKGAFTSMASMIYGLLALFSLIPLYLLFRAILRRE